MSDKSNNKKIYKIVGTIAIGWSLLMGGAIIGSYTAQKSFEVKDPYLKKIILKCKIQGTNKFHSMQFRPV